MHGKRKLKREWRRRRGHFEGDANVPKSEPQRILWLIAGFTALGLTVAGIALPIMPGWIFAIVAATCFGRSSPRFYNWVLSNKHAGPVAFEWREQRTLPRRVKWGGLALLVGGLGLSIALFVPQPIGRIVLGVLGVTAAVLLFRVRTAPRRSGASRAP